MTSFAAALLETRPSWRKDSLTFTDVVNMLALELASAGMDQDHLNGKIMFKRAMYNRAKEAK
jgi:hypothetical protein